MMFRIRGGTMDKKEIEKNWQSELQSFLKKVDDLPSDNPDKESEWEFSKETLEKLNKELTEIQEKYKKLEKDAK